MLFSASLAAGILVSAVSASPIYHPHNEHWTPEPAPAPNAGSHWTPGHWDQKPKNEEVKHQEHWKPEQPKHEQVKHQEHWAPEQPKYGQHWAPEQPKQDEKQHQGQHWVPEQPAQDKHANEHWVEDSALKDHANEHWVEDPKDTEPWTAPKSQDHRPTNKAWVPIAPEWNPQTHEYILPASVLTIRNVRDSVALASGDPSVFAAGSINDAQFRSTLFSVDVPKSHGDLMCEPRLALANPLTGESFATEGNRLALWEIKNSIDLLDIPENQIRAQGNIERVTLISKHVANLDGDSTFVEGEEVIDVKRGTQLNFELVADAVGMNVAWAAPALNGEGRPVGPYLYCVPRGDYRKE